MEIPFNRAEVFWGRVDKNGPTPDQSVKAYQGLGQCWEWKAGIDGQGYGCFWVKPKQMKTHRVSWMLTFGQIQDDLYVLHRCDNRACVNPSHLFIGTCEDNIADRHGKGRSNSPKGDKQGHITHPESVLRGDQHPSRLKPWTRPRGSAHGISKLTEAEVIEMRSNHQNTGASYKSLARRYGVSDVMIKHIIKRTYWKHV